MRLRAFAIKHIEEVWRKATMRMRLRRRYTHAFTCGEVHVRLALDPVVMLEPALEAVEAVYPAVQVTQFYHKHQRADMRRLLERTRSTPQRCCLCRSKT